MGRRIKPKVDPLVLAAQQREEARKPENWGPNQEALAGQEDVDVKMGLAGRVHTVRRRNGLDWLWSKGKLSSHQMSAATQYGDDYRSYNDVSLRSCCDDSVSGGESASAQDFKVTVGRRLDRARQDGLSGNVILIEIADSVAGEGVTIRSLSNGSDVDVTRKETLLQVALDLLAAHYGIKGICRTA